MGCGGSKASATVDSALLPAKAVASLVAAVRSASAEATTIGAFPSEVMFFACTSALASIEAASRAKLHAHLVALASDDQNASQIVALCSLVALSLPVAADVSALEAWCVAHLLLSQHLTQALSAEATDRRGCPLGKWRVVQLPAGQNLEVSSAPNERALVAGRAQPSGPQPGEAVVALDGALVSAGLTSMFTSEPVTLVVLAPPVRAAGRARSRIGGTVAAAQAGARLSPAAQRAGSRSKSGAAAAAKLPKVHKVPGVRAAISVAATGGAWGALARVSLVPTLLAAGGEAAEAVEEAEAEAEAEAEVDAVEPLESGAEREAAASRPRARQPAGEAEEAPLAETIAAELQHFATRFFAASKDVAAERSRAMKAEKESLPSEEVDGEEKGGQDVLRASRPAESGGGAAVAASLIASAPSAPPAKAYGAEAKTVVERKARPRPPAAPQPEPAADEDGYYEDVPQPVFQIAATALDSILGEVAYHPTGAPAPPPAAEPAAAAKPARRRRERKPQPRPDLRIVDPASFEVKLVDVTPQWSAWPSPRAAAVDRPPESPRRRVRCRARLPTEEVHYVRAPA